MYYLIEAGKVKAKYLDAANVLSHRSFWIESDEDIEIGSNYDGKSFSSDIHHEAIKLLLKSISVSDSDKQLRDSLLTKF